MNIFKSNVKKSQNIDVETKLKGNNKQLNYIFIGVSDDFYGENSFDRNFKTDKNDGKQQIAAKFAQTVGDKLRTQR